MSMMTYTQSLYRLPYIAVCLIVLLWPGSSWGKESPLQMIRKTTDQALAVLRDPTMQNQEGRAQSRQRLWDIIVPQFDTEEIAKRALGPHWQQLSEDQRREFVPLFTELIKRSYQGTLERYTPDTQLFYDREQLDGDRATVDTRIVTPTQEKSFSVNYQLHEAGDQWLIYDVIVENVSLVQNYRNQFGRILGKSSYQELVKTIRTKLAELDASSAQRQSSAKE
jgi:phospholipid transport system substrate-binding protein